MDETRRLAALGERAAAMVENGMVVGLGSGSTAKAFVHALGTRVQQGLAIRGIPTSRDTGQLAEQLGIPVITLSDTKTIDLGIDGADEIDPHLSLTKGRGAALLYEKMIATTCDRWIIVAASEKLVDKLGTRVAIPVEIIPFGWEHTQTRVEALGFEAPLRTDQKGAPIVTDGGHFLLDCATGPIDDPEALGRTLKSLTGVVEHGLFVGLAAAAYVCDPDGNITEHLAR